jgi:hypothetical protein
LPISVKASVRLAAANTVTSPEIFGIGVVEVVVALVPGVVVVGAAVDEELLPHAATTKAPVKTTARSAWR